MAIVIGISLVAFILGDILQSGSSLFQRDRMEIGEINGESVQYPQFQKQVEELGEIYKMNNQQDQLQEDTWAQVRQQTWENVVREQIMNDVYEQIGLTVSSEELFDMLQGTNLHPIVQQLFRNPNTGQVDRGAVVRFLQNLETNVTPEQRQYWLYLEEQIAKERIQSKYNNLITKGLYVTTFEAKKSLDNKSKEINFDYVMLANSSVADSLVTVTEKDLKDYYNSHQDNYKQEKSRRIEYVSFPVEPTRQDFKEAEEWIYDIVDDFAATTDNVSFVNTNSDESFDDTWYKKEDLPEDIAAWVFETNAGVNSIFGPYLEDETYKLAKLHASEMMPDSVEARHILLEVNTQEEVAAMQELADSLKTAIENGSDFAALAREFSTDRGSAMQGGDVGWFSRGQMVKPFENAAFNNRVNEITVVPSQFGIHIVQTTARGKETRQVQIAYLVRNVVPSTETYQDVYATASRFAAENTTKEKFDAAAAEQELDKKTATVGEHDRQIPGLENARMLIRAAYEAKPGELITDPQGSTIFELSDNFVVATLVSATEEGVAPFESVRQRIQIAVLRQKKAQFLVEKMRTAMEEKTNLADIAAGLGTTVKSASNINFNSLQIPGLGMEPALIGTVCALETDQVSEPFAGNSGAFIVKITSINETGEDQDIETEKQQLAEEVSFRASTMAYTAHKNNAEITDKRAKFY